MKKLVIIMSLFFLVCNAKRDNIYDPKNSDKAVIKGIIYEPDSLPVKDAFIELIHNDTTVKLDTSNISGEYGFEQIDLGIYKIIARTKYYDDAIIEAESLWAGTDLNQYDMFFTTFHFEDDEINDTPYAFNSMDGIWKVITDSTLNHSSNRVYNGTAFDSGQIAMTFFRSQTHMMDFNLKIKVFSTSGENWETGILFGYQDQRNYFVIKISKSLVKYCGIEDSIETMFYSKQINFSTDVWHSIKTLKYEGALLFHFDDIYAFPISLINTSSVQGFWGLYISNKETGHPVSLNCDDIYLRIVNP